MTERIYLTRKIEDAVSDYDNLSVAIEKLSECLAKIPEEYRDSAQISFGESFECPYCNIEYSSPETDKEYQKRIEQDERIRELRRKQYEALKKEFGE